MKIKALCSFSGRITMTEGETRECDNEYIVNDLLRAGYVEAVQNPPPANKADKLQEKTSPKTARKKKAVEKNENQ